MARFFEIRKCAYRRDVMLFGRRVFSVTRTAAVHEAMLHHLEWQSDYRTLRQHGLELPGESAYYWTGHYEVANVRLGDLSRYWKGRAVPLAETGLGRFVAGADAGGLRRYYEEMAEMTAQSGESVDESVSASMQLFEAMKDRDYDPSVCCITVNSANVILDGFHRSSFLLARHGPDYKIKVVRVLPDFR